MAQALYMISQGPNDNQGKRSYGHVISEGTGDQRSKMPYPRSQSKYVK